MKKVKDVVKVTGLSRRTLQYYDDIGLMNVNRSALNYRQYSEEDLKRLWRVLIYKEMGFNLNEIRNLLNADEENRCQLLEAEMVEVQGRIMDLDRVYRFIGKVKDNGIPELELVRRGNESKTYRGLAKLMAERV